jgi:hypothetical protein
VITTGPILQLVSNGSSLPPTLTIKMNGNVVDTQPFPLMNVDTPWQSMTNTGVHLVAPLQSAQALGKAVPYLEAGDTVSVQVNKSDPVDYVTTGDLKITLLP